MMHERAEPSRTGSDRRLYIALAVVFLLSRLAAHGAGLHFDATPLGTYWQYLDPRLLEGDLLRSLFYLHSQPPLFNLFLGLVLKISPIDPAYAFHAVYFLAGYTCGSASFFVMRRLGVTRVWAFPISALLVIRPDFVILEHQLTYDVPVTALLCLSAVFLVLFIDKPSRIHAHAFFLTLMAVCATRSLFHPIYLAAVAALLLAMNASQRAPLLRAAALPALFLLVLMTKNFVVFGSFGTSTWLGMNLWRIASTEISTEEIARLQRDGKLSDIASIRPFSKLSEYPAAYLADPDRPDVPAVADPARSTGANNYNHQGYVDIARSYYGDAMWILRHRPEDYLRGVAKAWYYYHTPQTPILQVRELRDQLAGYSRFGETWLYGKLPWGLRYGDDEHPIYLFSMIGIPALFAYALYLSVSIGSARRSVMAFLAFTLIYVAVVGNSLEVLENQRFRFHTDPFFAVSLALACDQFARWARGSLHSGPSSR